MLCASTAVGTAAELNPLFQDNAVLQCGTRVPVWGTGRDGETVTVKFGGQRVSTSVTNGVWKVWLGPMPPEATPASLTVQGDTTRVLTNILVGEVWIAGGQSNMERELGLRAGQKPIVNWEQEVAAANHPEIRQFYVPQTRAFAPQTAVKGAWSVCSPETVASYTAVGYFFARDLLAARHVPIGIIHSSWGGTPAEAWTSDAALQRLPGFAGPLSEVHRMVSDPEAVRRETREKLEAWYQAGDPGSKAGAVWNAPDLDVSDWDSMKLPTLWESAGYDDFDGIVWYRREIELPEDWKGGDAELHLGMVDDVDTTWINGVQVGATLGWDQQRVYRVPAGTLKPGRNVIAVRVLDTGGGGGLYGGDDAMRLVCELDGKIDSLPLDGPWRCKQGVSLRSVGWPPSDFSQSASAPTVLYNGMIAPLLPYAIRGVIWYQGEANVGRERQYQTLFPALMADWRQEWGQGDFPFLFVQIAPYSSMTPEIREAQLLSWQRTPNTAMVVTTDCGDADDIHPAYKQPVGTRLALAARALAYGERIEYSGPVFESMKINGGDAILSFTHLGGGLVAKDGALKGFVVAGADKVFHPAEARVVGDTVVVSSTAVPQPVAVRYGWANVPEVNLFNRAGLPATPFRTDLD